MYRASILKLLFALLDLGFLDLEFGEGSFRAQHVQPEGWKCSGCSA
jgi:hypothetical protein